MRAPLIANRQCSLVPMPHAPRLGDMLCLSSCALDPHREAESNKNLGDAQQSLSSLEHCSIAQTLTGHCLCLPLSGYRKHTYQGMESFSIYIFEPLIVLKLGLML